jgi:hypothetical protein
MSRGPPSTPWATHEPARPGRHASGPKSEGPNDRRRREAARQAGRPRGRAGLLAGRRRDSEQSGPQPRRGASRRALGHAASDTDPQRTFRSRSALDAAIERPLACGGRVLRERTLLLDGRTELRKGSALAVTRSGLAHDRARAARRKSEGDRHRSEAVRVYRGERDEANAGADGAPKLPDFGHPHLAGAGRARRPRAARKGAAGLHRPRVPERGARLGRERVAAGSRVAEVVVERGASRVAPVAGGSRSPRHRSPSRHFDAHRREPAQHRIPQARRVGPRAGSRSTCGAIDLGSH